MSRGEVSLQHPLGDGSETVIKEFTSRRLGCGNKLQLTFLANESNITNPNESDITSLLIQVANNDIFICAVRFSCKYSSYLSFLSYSFSYEKDLF